MDLSARARATEPTAIATRPVTAKPSWLRQVTSLVLAVGALLLGDALLADQPSAQADSSTVIGKDSSAKSAAREAKRAERAAAREAKKKERASRANKSDDRTFAKSKTKSKSKSKDSSSSSLDLGDNDPLEGL